MQKTKELMVDFRKFKICSHSHIYINEAEVKHVSTLEFLEVHIAEDLSWTSNTLSIAKKAQQYQLFQRRLRIASLSPKILSSFYRCTTESILTAASQCDMVTAHQQTRVPCSGSSRQPLP